LSGRPKPGSIITIYQDGVQVLLPTVTADANGNWSYTPALPLGEGAHTFEVTATLNGETSGRLPATVTVDLTALMRLLLAQLLMMSARHRSTHGRADHQ
jgi:hypothetical protein